MKGVRWFQRFMITALLGANAFVFTSLQRLDYSDRIAYTLMVMLGGLLLISMILGIQRSYRSRKKVTVKED